MKPLIGEGALIHPLAKIVNDGHLELGAFSTIDDFVFLNAGTRTVIGRYVHVASHVSITGGGELEVGDYAVIATGARILTATDTDEGGARMSTNLPDQHRSVFRAKVTIAGDAFVGANAVVLPGVTLAEGCVVGAGAVVTHDLDPWTVYVGTPARPLRPRPRPSRPGP
jgi:acetyltransferase-like isoleucine patch superfamily enzyme